MYILYIVLHITHINQIVRGKCKRKSFQEYKLFNTQRKVLLIMSIVIHLYNLIECIDFMHTAFTAVSTQTHSTPILNSLGKVDLGQSYYGHFHGKGCTLEINETHPKYLGWLPLFQFISCTYIILCWRNLHAKFHPQIPCNFYFMAHYVCKFDLFGVSFKFWQFPSKWQNRKSFTYIHSTLQESCVMSHKCAWQISARLVK